jgi:hypothetical protein
VNSVKTKLPGFEELENELTGKMEKTGGNNRK